MSTPLSRPALVAALALPVVAALTAAAPAHAATLAEGTYNEYDQGVRHIATLAGYFSYGLMALAVCFGVLTTTGWAKRSVKRQTLYGGHMMLAVICLSFGCIHALAYVFQTGVHFTYVNMAVPFVAGGQSDVAWGIIGLELGLAVAVSIWVQKLLGYRRWHIVHYLAYPSFGLSLLHVVTASAEVQALGLMGMFVCGIAGAPILLFILRLLPATTAVAARIAPQEV
ncbi:ferric reductase-like transmembrane domain-containing protein [Kitasatospora sp. RB6PN24]|uniref:ferric reductase-like transmembrane domain-containing protein n=1 Tax=Kitasatospora humi TaxID=2893891 RepID=UPI001E2BABE8|nr:ferric reductase-like transmembrane domain-containing protein [Kitasatospora humi]MCC9311578.1 ferric reductase-like transmembrane domain-containing protein [Kitasatospora humi]